jgi:hypothetical protein
MGMTFAQWAGSYAEGVLSARRSLGACPSGRRAGRPGRRRPVVPGELDILIAAGWLHDIGYAPALATTGFIPWTVRHLEGLGVDRRL